MERLQDEINGGKPTKAGSNPELSSKEQEVAHLTKCTCERCTGIAVESLYEEQPEPPKLTRKDWEEWADRMETHIIMRDDIKGAFLTMPGVPKELP